MIISSRQFHVDGRFKATPSPPKIYLASLKFRSCKIRCKKKAAATLTGMCFRVCVHAYISAYTVLPMINYYRPLGFCLQSSIYTLPCMRMRSHPNLNGMSPDSRVRIYAQALSSLIYACRINLYRRVSSLFSFAYTCTWTRTVAPLPPHVRETHSVSARPDNERAPILCKYFSPRLFT